MRKWCWVRRSLVADSVPVCGLCVLPLLIPLSKVLAMLFIPRKDWFVHTQYFYQSPVLMHTQRRAARAAWATPRGSGQGQTSLDWICHSPGAVPTAYRGTHKRIDPMVRVATVFLLHGREFSGGALCGRWQDSTFWGTYLGSRLAHAGLNLTVVKHTPLMIETGFISCCYNWMSQAG